MGLFFRMFAPSSVKKVRRAAHPVSLMTPRPVRKAKMAAVNAKNPAGGVKRAAKRRAVRSVRSSKVVLSIEASFRGLLRGRRIKGDDA